MGEPGAREKEEGVAMNYLNARRTRGGHYVRDLRRMQHAITGMLMHPRAGWVLAVWGGWTGSVSSGQEEYDLVISDRRRGAAQ